MALEARPTPPFGCRPHPARKQRSREYIKTHGVQKAIEALGVDLVLQSIDWKRQPAAILEQLPTFLLERLPDSVLERLLDPVLKRLPREVILQHVEKSQLDDKKKRFSQNLET